MTYMDHSPPHDATYYLQRIREGDAEALEFENVSFDAVICPLGMLHFPNPQKAISEAFRVLKPGGRLLVLEFSKPGNPLLSKVYDTYSFKVLPLMGKLVTNDADSYTYLAESIRMHPDQQSLKEMMEDAGFSHCEYNNMTGGVVAVHRGIKP